MRGNYTVLIGVQWHSCLPVWKTLVLSPVQVPWFQSAGLWLGLLCAPPSISRFVIMRGLCFIVISPYHTLSWLNQTRFTQAQLSGITQLVCVLLNYKTERWLTAILTQVDPHLKNSGHLIFTDTASVTTKIVSRCWTETQSLTPKLATVARNSLLRRRNLEQDQKGRSKLFCFGFFSIIFLLFSLRRHCCFSYQVKMSQKEAFKNTWICRWGQKCADYDTYCRLQDKSSLVN